MLSTVPLFRSRSIPFPAQFSALLALLLGASIASGCSSGMPMSMVPPPPPGPTTVPLLLSSTANDKLVQFQLSIVSITLTDKSGHSVPLYSNANLGPGAVGATEFMHLNGVSEPLVTASIPQGTYSMASVIVGFCDYTNAFDDSMGGLTISTYAEGLCGQGTGNTTVNLPSPIAISSSPMALSLNLQVPQSYTLNGMGASATYTISPVFTLSPVPISSRPANNQNGKVTGINAQITSINTSGNGFIVKTGDGFSLNVKSDNNTVYQGVAGFSTLAAGTLVNMDLAIQPDASLLATRIEVDDLAAPSTTIGPLQSPTSNPGQFVTFLLEGVGCTTYPSPSLRCDGLLAYDTKTIFSVSGQLGNLQSLPFAASFSGASFFPGQNISVFSAGLPASGSFATASTITLAPQSLNGTVTAVSTIGAFNVYTVALAGYDLIPILQVSLAPANRLPSPGTVVVYADANTQLLNSTSICIGSVLRFRGLLFNDNGSLRMDCAQINDGVPE